MKCSCCQDEVKVIHDVDGTLYCKHCLDANDLRRGRAPFLDGSLLKFYDRLRRGTVTWMPYDTVYVMNLTCKSFERQGSSISFEFQDSEGRVWPFFLSEFMNMVKKATLVQGSVHGKFKVAKKSQVYSLRYLGDFND